MWLLCGITFFLSAILDNLTTAIVMVSLVKKLVKDKQLSLLYSGLIVVAANSGGAWSPIGDVTTTMLWISGQVSSLSLIKHLILPSMVSLAVPLMVAGRQLRGRLELASPDSFPDKPLALERDRNIVFFTGLIILLFVPVFKTLTHLPPYMGMLLGLGVIWVVTELIHKGKEEEVKSFYSVMNAIRKVDTPSILFFLGILISVAALESLGVLHQAAAMLDQYIGNKSMIVTVIGLLSAVVDNVPLVAASMGMYTMDHFPPDDAFWHLLAFCAGTGGSILIIGSAAGVAAMGIEKIEFFWYIKKIAWLALLGYISGILVFLALQTS
jgi:Na+/H+ antiporter NhaD/arsenite permease-like protein